MSSSSLEAELAALARSFPGRVAFAARCLDTGDQVTLDGDHVLPLASSGKLFVLFALLSAADRAELRLDERVELTAPMTLGSGVLAHLEPGLRPTVWDLAVLMQMVSDNTAANLLIERLGVGVINRELERAGLSGARLHGGIDFAALATDPGAFAVGSPSSMLRFVELLRSGRLLSPPSTDRFWKLLRVQKYIEPLRRLLPTDPYAQEFGEPEPVWVASKTGSLRGLRTETGLVHAYGREWAVSVITWASADPRVTSDHEGWRLVSETSRLLFETWAPAQST